MPLFVFQILGRRQSEAFEIGPRQRRALLGWVLEISFGKVDGHGLSMGAPSNLRQGSRQGRRQGRGKRKQCFRLRHL